MITFSHTSVFNLGAALRGARNPMNSWQSGDSTDSALGPNDLALAKKLCAAGPDHRKFMRQILVSVDIEAPLYWWKEFDTYKVGTTANSCSTMHRIHSKPFDMSDFSTDHLTPCALSCMKAVVTSLEALRLEYMSTKDKTAWYSIIQLLPSSYNQLRTITLSYENVLSMVKARKSHKLNEWREFCSSWAMTLPHAEDLFLS